MKKIVFIVVAGWSFASQAMDPEFDFALTKKLIESGEYGIAGAMLPNQIGKKNAPLLLKLYLIQNQVDKLSYGPEETKLKNRINELIKVAPETTRGLIELLIDTKTTDLLKELAEKNELIKKQDELLGQQATLLNALNIEGTWEMIYPED